MNNKSLDYRIGKLFGDDIKLSLDIMNWDRDYLVDMATGNGFEIKKHAFKKVKGVQVKNDEGSHSRLFGSSYEDEDAFAEVYSCKCGEIIGNRYEGEKCPTCHTEVKYVGTNMKMTAWMRLTERHMFIHPIYYHILKKTIGDKAFSEIVNYDMDIDLNGSIIKKDKETDNKFYGIGVSGFREKFIKILTYYMNETKINNKKRDTLQKIMQAHLEGKVFQRSIPVFSSLLRDTKMVNDEYWYHKIDKKINMMFSQVRLLNGFRSVKGSKELAEEYAISNLQNYLMSYWDIISSEIVSKEGLIKDGILGGRINFSARDVIVADPTLRNNRVKVGYVLFLELYKFELINFIAKMRDISPNEAFETWSRAKTHFDEKMWKLMNHYVQKYKPRVLVNRNPTINFGSIMLFYIDSVEEGYFETFVLKLPILTLSKFNADFDGDRLNIVSIKIKKHEKEFDKKLEPRTSMQISRITGRFDEDMGLMKDQIVGLHIFNNI